MMVVWSDAREINETEIGFRFGSYGCFMCGCMQIAVVGAQSVVHNPWCKVIALLLRVVIAQLFHIVDTL